MNRCVAGDLQTCSPAGTWQSTGTATRQLLTNPSFEAGETGWTTSVAGDFPVVYAANGSGADNTPELAAQSRPNLAWLGGYARANDVLSQRVTIPAGATSIIVSFYYAIFTSEVSPAENDVMDVRLVAGTQSTTLAHFSDNDEVHNWTRFSAPVPVSFVGQAATLELHSTTNATFITSFYVDTVAVEVVACP